MSDVTHKVRYELYKVIKKDDVPYCLEETGIIKDSHEEAFDYASDSKDGYTYMVKRIFVKINP